MAEENTSTSQANAQIQATSLQTSPPDGLSSANLASLNKDANSGIVNINREFQEKSVMKKAYELKMDYINIAKIPLNPDFLNIISEDQAKAARAISFLKIGKKLKIAVVDPINPETINLVEEFKKQGYEVIINLASESSIEDALKAYQAAPSYKKFDIVENVEEKSIKTYEKEIKILSDLSSKLDTMVAEETVNVLNVGAIKTGASDVHYEPTEKAVTVRFRIDGMLHKVFELKPATYANILNQIKYKSKMQLNINNIPQDGRFDFMFNDKKVDVRVSAIPTPAQESLVLRYLVPSEDYVSFENLGFEELALKKVLEATKIANGMVLCTGPTGSGKTTTLYSFLQTMKTPEKKIITLEDPVEYMIEGVTHSQINEKRGYDFASGLRAILRQDPNIIMLGEIRDLETAETASQAALTGHVLLSTLHTNSAIEAVPRLINMGLPRYMVASALNTVIAQRLVRKVCPKCVQMVDITESEKEEFEKIFTNLNTVNKNVNLVVPQKLPKIVGCDFCSQTGYKGRLVIDEVIVVDQTFKRMILEEKNTVDFIALVRKDGFITMREDGFIKIAKGLTTLEEVHRVTNIAI